MELTCLFLLLFWALTFATFTILLSLHIYHLLEVNKLKEKIAILEEEANACNTIILPFHLIPSTPPPSLQLYCISPSLETPPPIPPGYMKTPPGALQHPYPPINEDKPLSPNCRIPSTHFKL
jgi:hypothetical protein